jgi:hypothetical protein
MLADKNLLTHFSGNKHMCVLIPVLGVFHLLTDLLALNNSGLSKKIKV